MVQPVGAGWVVAVVAAVGATVVAVAVEVGGPGVTGTGDKSMVATDEVLLVPPPAQDTSSSPATAPKAHRLR